MGDLTAILSTSTAIFGILVSAIYISCQITIQKRLNYITTMLADKEIMHWYKVFLKDLHFIQSVMSLFPTLETSPKQLQLLQNNKEKHHELEKILAYIRHVLRGDERLRSKFPTLSQLTDTNYDPASIFTDEYYPMLNDFIRAISSGISFHCSRSWFVTLFYPAKERYNNLNQLLGDRNMVWSPEKIRAIEFEIRQFMMSRW